MRADNVVFRGFILQAHDLSAVFKLYASDCAAAQIIYKMGFPSTVVVHRWFHLRPATLTSHALITCKIHEIPVREIIIQDSKIGCFPMQTTSTCRDSDCVITTSSSWCSETHHTREHPSPLDVCCQWLMFLTNARGAGSTEPATSTKCCH